MAAFFRALLPVFALGAGTWLGMGRPDLHTLLSAESRVPEIRAALAKLLPPAPRPGPAEQPSAPPLDRDPSTVDASALPDPPSPFPRLNPQASVERAWLVAEGPPHAPTDGHRFVTFTFDDGPFPETAPTVLRILDLHRIRATFFFIGKYLEGDDHHAVETRVWARRIADAGHLVGNHTLDHKVLTSLPHAAALNEIDESAAAIERATGKRPLLFRPPYGEIDPWLEGALRERKQELLLWSIDVEDMKKKDPDEILAGLQSQLEYKQGGIVLLHDMHWASVKALNRLVRWLESNRWDPSHPDHAGWDIVDLPTYLRETQTHPQPYATREELERARQARNGAGPRAGATPTLPAPPR
jgi:peptidoglycan/xylan/chitin deacetylase (PgdA/CDA1 family)